MKKSGKALALVLAVIMTAAVVFSSCARSGSGNDTTGETERPGTETTSGEPVTEPGGWEKYTADVPTIKMNGRSVTFLSANWASYDYQTHEIFAEEYTTEPINDAMFDRIIYMEDKYDCEIKVIAAYNASQGHEMLTQSILSDDENQSYDFYLDKLNRYSEMSVQGYLLDLGTLKYCDFTRPYWDSDSYNDLSYFGYHFAVCGDVTLVDKDYTGMLVFNKEMYEDIFVGEELPYEIVRRGEWTFDKLYEIAGKAASDDVDNERWGLAIFRDTLLTFMVGGGYRIGYKDENDKPVISLAEKTTMDWSLHLMEKFNDTATVLNIHSLSEGDGGSGTLAAMFEDEKDLISYVRGNEVEFFRQTIEFDFGILPTPKSTELQKDYYTDVNPWGGVCLTMPVNARGVDELSAFIEDFACQGRNTVIPKYYDVLLDFRYAKDEDSQEMLDIVFSHRLYDVGAIGNWNNFAYDYIAMTTKHDTNLQSFINSNLESINLQIDYFERKVKEKNPI